MVENSQVLTDSWTPPNGSGPAARAEARRFLVAPQGFKRIDSKQVIYVFHSRTLTNTPHKNWHYGDLRPPSDFLASVGHTRLDGQIPSGNFESHITKSELPNGSGSATR